MLDLITEQAIELMEGRAAAIFRYDNDRDGLVVSTQHNLIPAIWDLVVRPGEGNAGRAYQERRTVWTNEVMGEYTFSDEESQKIAEAQIADWGVVGIVAAPILIQDGVNGVLEVVFDQHREFTDEEISLVQNLADSAAVAINNARYIEETEQAREVAEDREKEATQLQDVTSQLASDHDLESVLELITAKAKELLNSDTSSIWRYDKARGGIAVPAWSGQGSKEAAEMVIPRASFLLGRRTHSGGRSGSKTTLSASPWPQPPKKESGCIKLLNR